MGIGAAISGFAQGAAQGIKLRSDLDDAEQRRGLMRTQQKTAELTNQLTEGQIARENERKAIREEGVALTKAYSTGEDAERFGFVLSEDEFGNKKYDPNDPANIRRNYDLNKDLTRRRAIAFDRNPDADVSALEDLQKKRYQERLNTAVTLADIGDWSGFNRAMKSVYSDFQDGRQFTGSKVFDSDKGKMVTMYYTDEKTSSPGEYTVPLQNLSVIARQGLNLNDALTHRLRVQDADRQDLLANSTINLQGVQQDLIKAQQKLVSVQTEHVPKEFKQKQDEGTARIEYYRRLGQAAVQNAATAAKKVDTESSLADISKLNTALNGTTDRIVTMLNIRKAPGDLASDEEKQLFLENQQIAAGAVSLVSQSVIATNGKTVVDAGQAINMARFGYGALKPENIETTMARFGRTLQEDAPGLFTVQYGGYRVPLTGSDRMAPQLRQVIEKRDAAKQGQGQPAAEQPRRGITAPPAAQITPLDTRRGLGAPSVPGGTDFMLTGQPR